MANLLSGGRLNVTDRDGVSLQATANNRTNGNGTESLTVQFNRDVWKLACDISSLETAIRNPGVLTLTIGPVTVGQNETPMQPNGKGF